MGILDIFKRNKPIPTPEYRSVGDVINFDEFAKTIGSGPRAALKLTTVNRCVSLISDMMAGLPLKLYSVDDEGFKTEIKGAFADIVTKNPCYNMSMHDLLKQLMVDLLLSGNAYGYITRNNDGSASGIHYIHPSKVNVLRPTKLDQPVRYQVTGINNTVEACNMIHIKGLSLDSYTGENPLLLIKQLLDIAVAAEKSAHSFFSGGCNTAGILNVQTPMTNAQKDELRRKIANNFNTQNGQPNSLMILEGNMSYTPVSSNPESSQLLQSRLFNNQQICLFFGVNPTLVQDLSHSSYSTVEATMLQFLQTTLQGHINTFESEFNRKLFTPSQRGKYELDFQTDELLRADSTARANVLNTYYQIGAFSSNDVRKILGLSKIDGGDTYLRPLNMTDQNQQNTPTNEDK